jgi:hypothetical protein
MRDRYPRGQSPQTGFQFGPKRVRWWRRGGACCRAAMCSHLARRTTTFSVRTHVRVRRDRLTIPEDRADHPLLAIGVDARALPHGDQRVILVTSGHSLLTEPGIFESYSPPTMFDINSHIPCWQAQRQFQRNRGQRPRSLAWARSQQARTVPFPCAY